MVIRVIALRSPEVLVVQREDALNELKTSAAGFAAYVGGRATYRWGTLELKLRDYVLLCPKTAFAKRSAGPPADPRAQLWRCNGTLEGFALRWSEHV